MHPEKAESKSPFKEDKERQKHSEFTPLGVNSARIETPTLGETNTLWTARKRYHALPLSTLHTDATKRTVLYRNKGGVDQANWAGKRSTSNRPYTGELYQQFSEVGRYWPFPAGLRVFNGTVPERVSEAA
ncbi:hypothetical protein NDU88_004629 [Pleurodeles waltl]|uniref:Uncharacterized protein n=1 Tax=Pleurodeles waltl TaxID=8319 RepID=A0AAV7TAA1_PLEWA|nr:hypothetical protein NDU88_004629 [Pleurodeles waltl]